MRGTIVMRSPRVLGALVGAAALALLMAAGAPQGAFAQSGTAAATMAPTSSAAQSGPTPTAMPLSGQPVEIGVALAQTGPTSLLGLDEVAGTKIALDYFNQRGGINGRPIQLDAQDTGSDAAGAINAFNALLGNNNIVGILGPVLSQQAFSADPIADKAGVPVIGPSNTAAGIPQIGPFVSRVSAPVAIVAPFAVKAALKIDPTIKNVAVLYAQDDAFSKSETGTFQQTVKDLGLNLLPVQTFLTTDRDFTTQATNVLGESPDLIIISGLTADGGNLVKQLRELGYTKQIVAGNGLNTPNVYPVCGAQCDGLIIAQAYSYNYDSPINNDFRAAYKALNNGKEPGQLVAQAFTGIEVYVDALRALDSKSPLSGMNIADLRKALNAQIQGGTYDTPLGPISFQLVKKANGDPGGGEIVQKQSYVAQIKMNADGKTGQFVFLN
ncbi:MAG: ABC transporter substrate-binding protein [Aggregatilineales bacterium]